MSDDIDPQLHAALVFATDQSRAALRDLVDEARLHLAECTFPTLLACPGVSVGRRVAKFPVDQLYMLALLAITALAQYPAKELGPCGE